MDMETKIYNLREMEQIDTLESLACLMIHCGKWKNWRGRTKTKYYCIENKYELVDVCNVTSNPYEYNGPLEYDFDITEELHNFYLDFNIEGIQKLIDSVKCGASISKALTAATIGLSTEHVIEASKPPNIQKKSYRGVL